MENKWITISFHETRDIIEITKILPLKNSKYILQIENKIKDTTGLPLGTHDELKKIISVSVALLLIDSLPINLNFENNDIEKEPGYKLPYWCTAEYDNEELINKLKNLKKNPPKIHNFTCIHCASKILVESGMKYCPFCGEILRKRS